MKAKVLVVEDSLTQREHLCRLLERTGYEVSSVTDGLEALRAIRQSPPELVILDVVLDGMDGYSVCRWLRLTESTRDIAVIMLTVKSEVSERVEGLNVGADDYIAKPFDPQELEARIFAALRSRAARIELRQRNAELEGLLNKTERLAMMDELTGVFNRRRFSDVLRREWATARRYQHPLSLMILDVDRFKAVNDTHGHAAGDDLLVRIARIMSSRIREVDICARYGGDEFSLLLPHTMAEGARVVGQRIRDAIRQQREGWEGEAAKVSLSIGVASTEDASLRSPDELVEAADRALYEVKRDGRDGVLVARHGLLAR